MHNFTKGNIENHVEKIGIDVRPVIELKLEATHLDALYNKLVEKHPDVFERLVKGPNEFQIQKKFVFPGKGVADFTTLAITNRGTVFVIPRKMSIFEEETSLKSTEALAMSCLEIFRNCFPHKKIIRVGHINEYVFSLGTDQPGEQLIAERFTRISIPEGGEITLRVNRPDAEHNRVIQLKPVVKKHLSSQAAIPDEVKMYGLHVYVDLNNLNMTNPVDDDEARSIIQSSIEFNKQPLYDFLNSGL